MNSRSSAARIASLESELAEVRRERDEAVAACDANWVTHQEIAALRSALAASQEREGKLQEALATLQEETERLRDGVAAGTVSDGYHTHRELYEYRMLYNAHAAHGWLAAGVQVVKSRHHSDGEECFGGGWFIVTATLPTGQVSNHYRDEHWDLFDVPAVGLPPEYDGHTPADAAERLRAALSQVPEGEGGPNP